MTELKIIKNITLVEIKDGIKDSEVKYNTTDPQKGDYFYLQIYYHSNNTYDFVDFGYNEPILIGETIIDGVKYLMFKELA